MYVVFEGIDGAGKTTQIQKVKETLIQKANDRYYDKLEIIDIVEEELHIGKSYIPNTELTLRYALNRIPLQEIIHKNNHNIVLSDRSYISSIAYQGLVSRTYVENVNQFAEKPDLMFTFITNPANDYLEQVQQNYVAIAERMDNNIFVDTTVQKIKETTTTIERAIWDTWETKFKSIYQNRVYYDDSK